VATTQHRREGGLNALDLDAAIEAANVPTLLLVLTQLTGDLSWLEEPYCPTAPRGLDDNDTGGLPANVQRAVRSAARAAISRWLAGTPAAIAAPDTDLIVRMLSLAVGERVPAEYGPMVQADALGALTADEGHTWEFESPADLDVLIIGAGVSGICAAIRLQRAGIPYAIIERNDRVGGVWTENRYPAAAVDTPSHLYSYSFAPHDWPRWFGAREQIHAYLQEVAGRFGVLPHVTFGTTVRCARFDEEAQGWVVDVQAADGTRTMLRARVVISAVGAFNTPVTPRLPGLDSFRGPAFHTARWPADLDVAGKRVAVVGNGASAMQVVPAIAPEVASMTIFQMEPHWIAPFPKFKVPVPDPIRALMEAVPLYRAWYRARLSWTFNDKLHRMLRKDPSWPHPERSLNKANDRFREFLTSYIEAELGDRTDLLADLVPTYPPLGKRLLLDNGWYRAMRRDNVRLVSDPVTEVRPNGLVTRSGEEIVADIIVFATGFDVVNFLSTLEVVGRSGRSLRETWNGDDAAAYLGLAVPGFPNFFILYGPNTQTGHGGSLISLVEGQLNHIMSLLGQMAEDKLGTVEVRQEVYDSYNARVDSEHAAMVWTHPGMETYYRNSRGRVVVNSPFRVVDFWSMTSSARLADYLTDPDTHHSTLTKGAPSDPLPPGVS
jgi:4-hydroxyacetophenone monooxygenase